MRILTASLLAVSLMTPVAGFAQEVRSIPFTCSNCGAPHGDQRGNGMCPDCNVKEDRRQERDNDRDRGGWSLF